MACFCFSITRPNRFQSVNKTKKAEMWKIGYCKSTERTNLLIWSNYEKNNEVPVIKVMLLKLDDSFTSRIWERHAKVHELLNSIFDSNNILH